MHVKSSNNKYLFILCDKPQLFPIKTKNNTREKWSLLTLNGFILQERMLPVTEDILQHVLIQTQIGHQFLQPQILFL
jgi:hypothetical protein